MKDIITTITESRHGNVQFYSDLIHNKKAITQIITWLQSLNPDNCEGFCILQEKNQVILIETNEQGIPVDNRKKIRL